MSRRKASKRTRRRTFPPSQAPDTTNQPGATGPGQPNFYNVATHLGGLFIAEERHEQITLGPLIIELDNVATQATVGPGSSSFF